MKWINKLTKKIVFYFDKPVYEEQVDKKQAKIRKKIAKLSPECGKFISDKYKDKANEARTYIKQIFIDLDNKKYASVYFYMLKFNGLQLEFIDECKKKVCDKPNYGTGEVIELKKEIDIYKSNLKILKAIFKIV